MLPTWGIDMNYDVFEIGADGTPVYVNVPFTENQVYRYLLILGKQLPNNRYVKMKAENQNDFSLQAERFLLELENL